MFIMFFIKSSLVSFQIIYIIKEFFNKLSSKFYASRDNVAKLLRITGLPEPQGRERERERESERERERERDKER